MTLDYLGARIWWLGLWDMVSWGPQGKNDLKLPPEFGQGVPGVCDMVPSCSNHDVNKDKEHVLENPN
jgi:hypothetical protein